MCCCGKKGCQAECQDWCDACSACKCFDTRAFCDKCCMPCQDAFYGCQSIPTCCSKGCWATSWQHCWGLTGQCPRATCQCVFWSICQLGVVDCCGDCVSTTCYCDNSEFLSQNACNGCHGAPHWKSCCLRGCQWYCTSDFYCSQRCCWCGHCFKACRRDSKIESKQLLFWKLWCDSLGAGADRASFGSVSRAPRAGVRMGRRNSLEDGMETVVEIDYLADQNNNTSLVASSQKETLSPQRSSLSPIGQRASPPPAASFKNFTKTTTTTVTTTTTTHHGGPQDEDPNNDNDYHYYSSQSDQQGHHRGGEEKKREGLEYSEAEYAELAEYL